jgi:hypothetical protein
MKFFSKNKNLGSFPKIFSRIKKKISSKSKNTKKIKTWKIGRFWFFSAGKFPENQLNEAPLKLMTNKF